MRGRGVTYDTGFIHLGISTRESFDRDVVRRELRIIHDDLHCNAVRVTGGDVDRLDLAAQCAAEAGLETWFCPFTCDLTLDELLTCIGDSAERAERIRQAGAEVVLVTGSELTLFTRGFLPGDSLEERLQLFRKPAHLRIRLPEAQARLHTFLRDAVALAREKFGGRLTYASLPFEGIDWTPFDFVATDAGYRSADVADQFRDGMRALVARGKPVAITEFGCCTYVGAADQGARGDQIIVWEHGRPVRLNGTYARSECEQAAYIVELLDIFDAEGIDTVFVNTFARYDLPGRADPSVDLDLASYGIVNVREATRGRGTTYPDMAWEPKQAFFALADRYRA